MRADQHELTDPALRARYVRVLVWCKSCRHRRDGDLQGLVDAGRGDVPSPPAFSILAGRVWWSR